MSGVQVRCPSVRLRARPATCGLVPVQARPTCYAPAASGNPQRRGDLQPPDNLPAGRIRTKDHTPVRQVSLKAGEGVEPGHDGRCRPCPQTRCGPVGDWEPSFFPPETGEKLRSLKPAKSTIASGGAGGWGDSRLIVPVAPAGGVEVALPVIAARHMTPASKNPDFRFIRQPASDRLGARVSADRWRAGPGPEA